MPMSAPVQRVDRYVATLVQTEGRGRRPTLRMAGATTGRRATDPNPMVGITTGQGGHSVSNSERPTLFGLPQTPAHLPGLRLPRV
jgi:hypothetical protein